MQVNMPEQALAGLKVVELGHYIAGPFCGKVLGEYGAEVIKVERPGIGDGARRLGPFPADCPHAEASGLFLYLNTHKKGITLNLRSETGRKILRELVEGADILIENFEPRVLPSLGLSYEDLLSINPRLVMTSISNFGQQGPYRDYRASELVLAAMGGIMYITGAEDREPLKQGLSQAQYGAGENALIATLAAFYGLEFTGAGCHVDVSILESVVSLIFVQLSLYSYMGGIQRRQRNFGRALINVTPCKDGYIAPVTGMGASWEQVADFIGLPELRLPKFATAQGRNRHADELDALLMQWFGEHTREELFHSAQAAGLAYGLVQDPADLACCPQLEARGYFVRTTHPVAGELRYPGSPYRMSATPAAAPRPAPLLGQHNEEIFCGQLGYKSEDLIRLRQTGVI